MRPAAALLALTLTAACSSGSTVTTSATPPPTPAPAVATTTAPDPYEAFLALAPADAPQISRDDAQLRALLGCGKTFAPGTTDAALQQAYGGLIEQWKQQGMCQP